MASSEEPPLNHCMTTSNSAYLQLFIYKKKQQHSQLERLQKHFTTYPVFTRTASQNLTAY